jgi:hypothetical protein
MEASRVGPQKPFLEFGAADNQQHIIRNCHPPYSGYALGHRRTIPTHSDQTRRPPHVCDNWLLLEPMASRPTWPPPCSMSSSASD